MRKIFPVEIDEENFKNYGIILSDKTILSGLLKEKFYISKVTAPSGTFCTRRMERHVSTKEIFLCLNQRMVLTVAKCNVNERPKSNMVESFIALQNQIVVINEGIWHDVNHGFDVECEYYYLSNEVKGILERRWFKLDPEVVITEI